MKDYRLKMQWQYEYDKEGTWFSNAEGEESYPLCAGNEFPLPHIDVKNLEIRSVIAEGDTVTAEVYVDHAVYTVRSGEPPVTAHASHNYSVCGDSVWESMVLTLTIEEA